MDPDAGDVAGVDADEDMHSFDDIKQFVEDKDTRVSVGLDFPVARVPNQDGYFKTTKTTIDAIKNNIKLIYSGLANLKVGLYSYKLNCVTLLTHLIIHYSFNLFKQLFLIFPLC